MDKIKCVVVGDGCVGKTCMLISYTQNKFPTHYIPTVFENFAKEVVINNKIVLLDLFDTAGQEGYQNLRSLCYSEELWIPEILNNMPKTPFLIVGTQIDLRENTEVLSKLPEGEKPIDYKQGESIFKKYKNKNAVKYLECSALTQKGLKNVFDEAVLAVIKPTTKCFIL